MRKDIIKQTVPGLAKQRPASTWKKSIAQVGAWLLFSAPICIAQITDASSTGVPPPGAVGNTGAVAPAAGKAGSITSAIEADLRGVVDKVDAVTKEMAAANASNPAQSAGVVSNTAVRIRQLANEKLGETSSVVKEADGLVRKTVTTRDKVRSLAVDPKRAKRAKYADLLPELEQNVSEAQDARAAVNTVRAELLKKAADLEGEAEYIGLLDDLQKTEAAIRAFRDLLQEVSAFTARLGAIVDQVGVGRGRRVD